MHIIEEIGALSNPSNNNSQEYKLKVDLGNAFLFYKKFIIPLSLKHFERK